MKGKKAKLRLYYLVSFLVLFVSVLCSAVNSEYRKISIILCLMVMLVETFRCVRNKELSLFRGAIGFVIFVMVLMM